MSVRIRYLTLLVLGVLVFVVDRITKSCALKLVSTWHINSYLSFELAFNRGISWGLFSFDQQLGFVLVSLIVALILCFVSYWLYRAYVENHSIIGFILILAGGCSNLLDRIVYHGVVDFISLSYGSYQWPLFNIADIAVDVGVLILIFQAFKGK